MCVGDDGASRDLPRLVPPPLTAEQGGESVLFVRLHIYRPAGAKNLYRVHVH